MTRRKFLGLGASALAAPLALAGEAPSRSPTMAPGLDPKGRDLLRSYARDTWRSFEALEQPGGLPADGLRRENGEWVATLATSPTNIASSLWGTLAAEALGLVGGDEAGRRLGRTLAAVGRLGRWRGSFLNWYDPQTGRPLGRWPGGGGVVRPFASAVDNGWLAAALRMVGNARPAFRDQADDLLGPLAFGAFYDAPAGLLHGGFWPDDGSPASFHYGMLNTEPRIASYLGIARGEIPPDHYYRMSRGGEGDPSAPTREYEGVRVVEGSRPYRGHRVVPSWDGTMFEALMVPLFVPEELWAPSSWGVNHPLYVEAQVEYGLRDAKLGYWGASASSDPTGGYRAYGVAALGAGPSRRLPGGIVTPHASFLALRYAPEEALANLRALAANFPVYGSFGFLDAVDVGAGTVSERVLALDQGMILAAVANALEGDVLREALCDRAFTAAIRPLIAPERFDAGGARLARGTGRTNRASTLALAASGH